MIGTKKGEKNGNTKCLSNRNKDLWSRQSLEWLHDYADKEVGAVWIDMNGNVVKVWRNFQGFPNKILPGGYCMGSLGLRSNEFSYQDQTDLTQIDWDGNVVWSFDKKEYIEDEGETPRWMLVNTMTISVKETQ